MGDHPLIRSLGGGVGGDPEVAQTRIGMVVALLLGAFGSAINRSVAILATPASSKPCPRR